MLFPLSSTASNGLHLHIINTDDILPSFPTSQDNTDLIRSRHTLILRSQLDPLSRPDFGMSSPNSDTRLLRLERVNDSSGALAISFSIELEVGGDGVILAGAGLQCFY